MTGSSSQLHSRPSVSNVGTTTINGSSFFTPPSSSTSSPPSIRPNDNVDEKEDNNPSDPTTTDPTFDDNDNNNYHENASVAPNQTSHDLQLFAPGPADDTTAFIPLGVTPDHHTNQQVTPWTTPTPTSGSLDRDWTTVPPVVDHRYEAVGYPQAVPEPISASTPKPSPQIISSLMPAPPSSTSSTSSSRTITPTVSHAAFPSPYYVTYPHSSLINTGSTPANLQISKKEEANNNNNNNARYWEPLLPEGLFLPSLALSDSFARSNMSEDLLRIYHDSFENALCCWLTENNCPYSGPLKPANPVVNRLPIEWGPNWSNRICHRICKLERSFAIIRGRPLTKSEDETAGRALNTAIVAFASQWARGSRCNNMKPDTLLTTRQLERSLQEDMYRQAQHVLAGSTGIPSVRVMFAGIIFSITQRPLNVQEHMDMMNYDVATRYLDVDEREAASTGGYDPLAQFESDQLKNLLDTEGSCLPAESALRQLFSLRYQFSVKGERLRNASPAGAGSYVRRRKTPELLSPEDWETCNLLFWLGIMFDTLTAAMVQRPAVVADEDTQVSCTPTNSYDSGVSLNRKGSIKVRGHNQDVWSKLDLWGNLFLRTDAYSRASQWPVTFEEAAEILVQATPVKVLLFRHVMNLQSLLYRVAPPERMEEAIEKAIHVYQHWENTYAKFMSNCVAYHDSLPYRLQSWYLMLAGHWHYGVLLLVDAVESMEPILETKSSMVPIIRRHNALAICRLARRSLQQQQVQDIEPWLVSESVSEGVFLNEPWTAVLTRSFVKAGYIALNDVDLALLPQQGMNMGPHSGPMEYPWRLVGSCIDALCK